ncbi:MAG: hypothetical protein L6R37_008339 [Teloschistes peruensis]|nr:MAG: hypothetical protein L6R37_008339 [Teloschistes peruensis]
MEKLLPPQFYAAEPTGHVQIVSIDDGVLRHVLYLVGLGIRVRHGRILVVVVEPVLGGGEGFVGVSAQEVQGMAALVDEDGEVAVDAVEEGDVAVGVVGVTAGRVGKGDHVTDVLARVDGETAEEIDHIGERVRAGIVAAHDPCGAAVVVVDVVGLDVDGVEAGVLRHGFAVLWDPAGAPDVISAAVGEVSMVFGLPKDFR